MTTKQSWCLVTLVHVRIAAPCRNYRVVRAEFIRMILLSVSSHPSHKRWYIIDNYAIAPYHPTPLSWLRMSRIVTLAHHKISNNKISNHNTQQQPSKSTINNQHPSMPLFSVKITYTTKPLPVSSTAINSHHRPSLAIIIHNQRPPPAKLVPCQGAESIPSQLVSFDQRQLPHLMTSKGGAGGVAVGRRVEMG